MTIIKKLKVIEWIALTMVIIVAVAIILIGTFVNMGVIARSPGLIWGIICSILFISLIYVYAFALAKRIELEAEENYKKYGDQGGYI